MALDHGEMDGGGTCSPAGYACTPAHAPCSRGTKGLASILCRGPSGRRWLLVVAAAICLATTALSGWRLGPSRPAAAAFHAVATTELQDLRQPEGYGGVRQYHFPGVLHAADGAPVHGVLRVFVKAVNGSGGHLKLRGFLFFEFTEEPRRWQKDTIHYRVGVLNVPELYSNISLGLRARCAPTWERKVALHFQECAGIPASYNDTRTCPRPRTPNTQDRLR